jgi:hypothetical protein
MKTIWKCLKITVALFFLFGAVIIGYTAHQIAAYNRSRPSIIRNEPLVFKADSEIKLSDMATVKNSSEAGITSAEWSDGGHDKITITSGGGSVIVGDRTGKLIVMIEAGDRNRETSAYVYLTIE